MTDRLAVLALLACGGSAVAQQAPPATVDLETPAGLALVHEHWFAVRDGGVKVGWMSRSLARTEWEGAPAVETRMVVLVNIAGDGNTAERRMRFVFPLAGDQRLAYAEVERLEQGHRTARRVTRRGEQYEVLNVNGTREVAGVVVLPAYRLADHLSVERFVQRVAADPKAPENPRAIVVGIDLEQGRMGRRLIQLESPGEADPDAAYLLRYATGKDVWSKPIPVDEVGRAMRGEALLRRFTFQRRPQGRATDPTTIHSLEAARRIGLDQPLGDPALLRKLVLRVEGVEPEVFDSNERQRVERAEDGSLRLTITWGAGSGEVDRHERAAAGEPEPGVDATHPSIEVAATRVLAGTRRPAVQAQRLLGFTKEHVKYQVVLGEPSASEVLRRGRGDCSEHARLYVALCRASGLPARLVTGVVWMGDDRQAFSWHAWAEVELAGAWREVDPTSGGMPAHVARLRISTATRGIEPVRGMQVRLVEAERAKD